MHTGLGHDAAKELCAEVSAAAADDRPLYIHGGRSKLRLTGRLCTAHPISIAKHHGIISYRPEEMVLTARAGTSIRDLVEASAAEGQCLAFEPAEMNGQATIGGTLASGLSGPSRPWRGSVRDAVLGLRLINGQGEELRFGGEVMKNVAGYDVSRMQAGALGTLGLISEVSLRLLPRPAGRLHLSCEMPAEDALTRMRELAAKPLPLSGACWLDDTLHLRFDGGRSALLDVRSRLSNFAESSRPPWADLREWRLPALSAAAGFWGFDLAPATPINPELGTQIIDWGGARRFTEQPMTLDNAQVTADAARGHALRYGAGEREEAILRTPPIALMNLQRRLKHAMDPQGIFNPGRLHHWL